MKLRKELLIYLASLGMFYYLFGGFICFFFCFNAVLGFVSGIGFPISLLLWGCCLDKVENDLDMLRIACKVHRYIIYSLSATSSILFILGLVLFKHPLVGAGSVYFLISIIGLGTQVTMEHNLHEREQKVGNC